MAVQANFSSLRTVDLKPSYISNAMLNIFTMTPGFVVSTVILYVAFTSKSLRGQFKILIVALAFCSLFAVVVTLAFHLWFIAQLRCQKTIYFMTCSVMKRLFDHAQTPRIFCNLIIALDRYFTVICNKKYTSRLLFGLIIFSTLVAATVTLTNLNYGTVFNDDVCGSILAAPNMGNIVLGSWCVATILAFLINLKLMHFVFLHQKRVNLSERKKTQREMKNDKAMAIGLTVQSFIPLIPFTMVLTGLFMYFNNMGHLLPNWFWYVSLSIGGFNNTLIPTITAMSIRPFRIAFTTKFAVLFKLFSKKSLTAVSAVQQMSTGSINHCPRHSSRL